MQSVMNFSSIVSTHNFHWSWAHMRLWFKFIFLLNFFFISELIQFCLFLKLKLVLFLNEVRVKLSFVFFHLIFNVKSNNIITCFHVILCIYRLSHRNRRLMWPFLHIIHILNTLIFSRLFFINSQSINQIHLSWFRCMDIQGINRGFEY